ncbi:hypothetical protein CIP106467_4878 [Citrobacter europaeus]|nr:hypothetical protein CIP106467_4878 [Citrobacter europaeus]
MLALVVPSPVGFCSVLHYFAIRQRRSPNRDQGFAFGMAQNCQFSRHA